MSGLSLDAAKDAKEQVQSASTRDNDAGITEEYQVDYDNHSPVDVTGHAEAMIAFDHIARINIQDYGNDTDLLQLERNFEGAGQYGYGFDVELTLANPRLVTGQLWMEDTEEYPGYKVIGDPENDTNGYELREEIIKDDDGTPTGTEIKGIGNLGGNSWDGQPVEDGFDGIEYAQVGISASRAMQLLGALDTAGIYYTDQEGNVREGLFELPPNFGEDGYDSSDDGYPRLIGYPELRADMVGQSGAISFTFGDENSSGNRAKEVDIYKVEDGEITEVVASSTSSAPGLTPEDDAYALPEYPRGNACIWEGDSDGMSEDVDADAEPETDDGVAEAQAMMSDDGDDTGNESDDLTFEDLTDDEQEFVSDATEILNKLDADSVGVFAEESDRSFAARVSEQQATQNIQHSPDELASIIEDKV